MPETARTAAPPGVGYAGFAVFGGFWGTWGASIPQLREQAALSDGQLGTALLFVGLGALPAMIVAGRLVDRWGVRAAAVLLPLLGVVGVLIAVGARDLTTMCVALLVLGASSGAADIAINTAAGAAQQAVGRPVISRSHAVFSAAVVVASLSTGALRALGAPLVTAFALLAAATGAVAVALLVTAATGPTTVGSQPAMNIVAARRSLPVLLPPLLVLGAMGAVGFAVENGHQSWSALYLQDVLHAGPATAAAGPAVFAAIAAVTRLTTGSWGTRRPRAVLLLGSSAAAAGTTLVSVAPSLAIALLGLGVAAAGTSVLFPTLLAVLTSRVPDRVRGTATSMVTTVAYLGFLAGPVYVGLWAQGMGLPGAMLALAALAAGLAVLTPALLGRLIASPTSWATSTGPPLRGTSNRSDPPH